MCVCVIIIYGDTSIEAQIPVVHCRKTYYQFVYLNNNLFYIPIVVVFKYIYTYNLTQ